MIMDKGTVWELLPETEKKLEADSVIYQCDDCTETYGKDTYHIREGWPFPELYGRTFDELHETFGRLENRATLMSSEEYASQFGGVVCPRCRSTDLAVGEVEFEGTRIWQNIGCEDCGLEYQDQYELVGYELNDL